MHLALDAHDDVSLSDLNFMTIHGFHFLICFRLYRVC